jgi:hypothetical protein
MVWYFHAGGGGNTNRKRKKQQFGFIGAEAVAPLFL